MKKSRIAVLILLVIGTGLCITAVWMGSSGIGVFSNRLRGLTGHSKTTTELLQQTGDIYQVEMDIESASCTIQYGSKWELQYTGDHVTWSNSGGKFELEQQTGTFFHTDDNTIVLTVPENAVIAGMDLELDAGKITISNFGVAGTISCRVNAGSIDMNQVTVSDLKLDTDVGSIDFDGIITNSATADCDVGSINLTLKPGSTIGYINGTVDAGTVSVAVNGYERLSGKDASPQFSMDIDEMKNQGNYGVMTINCDVGTVHVDVKV